MNIPVLGDSVPKRGNGLTRLLGKIVMNWGGWKFEGDIPNRPKMVCIFAPHTSNWDFVLAIAAIFVLKIDFRWIGKHTIFRKPFGGFMRKLGGIPIDRSKGQGLVDIMVEEFRKREHLFLGLAPEGTRKAVEKWKSGFYRIAVAAGVSIMPITFDYARKAMILGSPIAPTGNLDEDLAALRAFFENGVAKRPEGASLPSF